MSRGFEKSRRYTNLNGIHSSQKGVYWILLVLANFLLRGHVTPKNFNISSCGQADTAFEEQSIEHSFSIVGDVNITLSSKTFIRHFFSDAGEVIITCSNDFNRSSYLQLQIDCIHQSWTAGTLLGDKSIGHPFSNDDGIIITCSYGSENTLFLQLQMKYCR